MKQHQALYNNNFFDHIYKRIIIIMMISIATRTFSWHPSLWVFLATIYAVLEDSITLVMFKKSKKESAFPGGLDS